MKKILMSVVAIAAFAGALASCSPAASSTAASSATASAETSASASASASSNTGATGAAIKVFSRDGNSGTREAFTEKIGIKEAKKKDDLLVPGFSTVTSNGDMMAKVGAEPNAIGFASLDGLAGDSSVYAVTVDGVEADEATVLDGSYKLQRNFVYATPKEAGSRSAVKVALINSYVDFMNKTTEGLTAVQSEGGIVQADKLSAAVAWKDYAPKASWYATLFNADGTAKAEVKAETVNFGGSTSVEKVSEAVGTAWAQEFGSNAPTMMHNHQGSGAAATGLASGALDLGFLSRDLSDDEKGQVGDNGIICLDAVAVIVNAQNPVSVKNLTIQQIRDIYFNKAQVASYTQGDYSSEEQITTWDQLAK